MSPTKPKQPPAAASRPITITAVVDCVGALAERTVRGHLYLYDTNRAGGSSGHGTEELRTRVKQGDQLLWSAMALECEAYVAIDGIDIDSAVCEPERRVYPGTDISYWTGTVKAGGSFPLRYKLALRVGARTEPLTTVLDPALVG